MSGKDYIKALRDVLETLPKGYVSRKMIRGRETFYLQWREGGKVRSKYIKKDDVEDIREQIRRRHAIQEELVKTEAASKAVAAELEVDFESDVKYGSELFAFAHTAEKWECRESLKNVLWPLERQGEVRRGYMNGFALRNRNGRRHSFLECVMSSLNWCRRNRRRILRQPRRGASVSRRERRCP